MIKQRRLGRCPGRHAVTQIRQSLFKRQRPDALLLNGELFDRQKLDIRPLRENMPYSFSIFSIYGGDGIDFLMGSYL